MGARVRPWQSRNISIFHRRHRPRLRRRRLHAVRHGRRGFHGDLAENRAKEDGRKSFRRQGSLLPDNNLRVLMYSLNGYALLCVSHENRPGNTARDKYAEHGGADEP